MLIQEHLGLVREHLRFVTEYLGLVKELLGLILLVLAKKSFVTKALFGGGSVALWL